MMLIQIDRYQIQVLNQKKYESESESESESEKEKKKKDFMFLKFVNYKLNVASLPFQ